MTIVSDVKFEELAQHIRERCCGTCLCKMDVAAQVQALYTEYAKLKEQGNVYSTSGVTPEWGLDGDGDAIVGGVHGAGQSCGGSCKG